MATVAYRPVRVGRLFRDDGLSLMTWHQVVIATTESTAIRDQEYLEGLGAESVTFKIADHEITEELAPNTVDFAHTESISALFSEAHFTEKLLKHLRSTFTVLNVEILADTGWETAWQAHFKPITIRPGLIVGPLEQAADLPEGTLYVKINPGLAFGTGTHPTTQLCLRWLGSQSLQGKKVLDFGCGSGILAITAALLGAECVAGIDHDPQALWATRENATMNAISDDKLVLLAPKDLSGAQYDVLVANILLGPLVSLSRQFTEWLKPQGTLVLSGLLEGQVSQIIAAYPNIVFESPTLDAGWVCLVGTKQLL